MVEQPHTLRAAVWLEKAAARQGWELETGRPQDMEPGWGDCEEGRVGGVREAGFGEVVLHCVAMFGGQSPNSSHHCPVVEWRRLNPVLFHSFS